MKYAISTIAVAAGSSALVTRGQNQQCVQLQASGGASGILGQLSDGQNRVGGGYGAACYCLDGNGGFTDSNGRGCILTPPTTQLQCDVGASPTNGFSINGGSVAYNGNTKFYACPVNDNGEYNVYTEPAPGQTECVEITLSAGQACGGGKGGGASPPASQPAQSQPAQSQPSPSTPPPSTPPSESQPGYSPAPQPPSPPQESRPAPSQPGYSVPQPPQPSPSQPAQSSPPSNGNGNGNSCPADLNGQYQYPHLIIPVSSSQPSAAPGTSYNGKANGDICSLFNFDIPQSYSGNSCSLLFLFPEQKDLETSSYTVSGSGGLEFSKCETVASTSSSWDNKGPCTAVKTIENVSPGSSYSLWSEFCPAGQTVTVQMCATGSLSLDYFQDYNPSPIGAYVREC